MLKKFFCMNLNTAGVVIGWVGAACSFLMCISLMFVLIYQDTIFSDLMMENPSFENIKNLMIISVSIILAFNVINMTASVLLVAGTIKERHLMLTPWLINSGISLMFSILLLLLSTISLIVEGYQNQTSGPSLLFILYLSIQLYVWCAVYSLYKQYKANREQNLLVEPNRPKSPSYTKI